MKRFDKFVYILLLITLILVYAFVFVHTEYYIKKANNETNEQVIEHSPEYFEKE